MNDPGLLFQVILLAFAAIALLLSVIGWFLRKDYKRMEDGLAAESGKRETELKNERDARGKDRHELRDEINAERIARHAFELKVTAEYPNMARLGEALSPFKEAIDSMRADQRELFDRLHGKEDKRRGGD